MPIKVALIPNITEVNSYPFIHIRCGVFKESSPEDKLANTLVTNAESFQVDMLLGNNYYFDLLQPRKIDTGNRLYQLQSKLGWVCGGKVTTETSKALLVSITGAVPINMWTTTHMLSAIDPCIASKPSIKLFWELKSLEIMKSPSTS